MARKAPWEIAYDAKPDDFDLVQATECRSRRYVFSWKHRARVQPATSGWRRWYEVYPPPRCRTCGGAREWSADGGRSRCPACERFRTRKARRRRSLVARSAELADKIAYVEKTRPHDTYRTDELHDERDLIEDAIRYLDEGKLDHLFTDDGRAVRGREKFVIADA